MLKPANFAYFETIFADVESQGPVNEPLRTLHFRFNGTPGQVPVSSHAIYHAFSYSRQSLQLAQRSPSALQLN